MSVPAIERPDVPAHLKREWDLSKDPLAATCPFHAASKLLDGPPIFFATGDEHPKAQGRGGKWVVVTAEWQREVLQSPDVFSSHLITAFSKMMGEDWPLVPLELDPPEHTAYRLPLNSVFSPSRVKDLEPSLCETAVELIEKVRGSGGCEFMEAFGKPFPVGAFVRLMGLDPEETDMLLGWEEGLLRGVTMDDRARAATAIREYLVKLIAERKRNPSSDLVSYVVGCQVDGVPISDEKALGICYLFYVAGLDTVASSLGWVFRELAMRPELQRQLREDRGLIPNAVEEFFRAFGIVVTHRYLARDHEFHGIKMKEGDLVEIPLGCASRDPSEYENPHLIDFRRENTRNITFAAGPHRCIGSHLARREMKIAIEEWMDRVPEFRIKPGETPEVQAVSVWGVNRLPLVW